MWNALYVHALSNELVRITGREKDGREQRDASDDHHRTVEESPSQTVHSHRYEYITRDLDGSHHKQHEKRITGQVPGAQ